MDSNHKIKKKVSRIKRIMQNRTHLLFEEDRLEFASILKEKGECEELYNEEVVNYNNSHDKNKMLFIMRCTAPDLNIEITITKFKTHLTLKYGKIAYTTTTRDSGISVFELFLISLIIRFRRVTTSKQPSQTISV